MAEPIDEYFTTTIAALPDRYDRRRHVGLDAPVVAGAGLTVGEALEVFDAQLGSRHLDLAARRLRERGAGFYTIGSSGHESNAVVAAALRPSDPALLHYRSGGFFLHRAGQVVGSDPLRDVLLGVVAATEEPISGGRHKVFGRADLAVIPQTSTIASHLPRAVGVAFAITQAASLGVDSPWPADAVAVCSFGDASANHATAVGSINAAVHTAYRDLDLPLLFVCEDNGIGISTTTPTGWIAAAYGDRPGLAYFAADGSDLVAAAATARAAVDYVRTRRRPAFLHLATVRLMGHAGSDYELAYRNPRQISADYDRDPVLCTAKLLVEHGHLSPQDMIACYEDKRGEVLALAEQLAALPQLDSPAAVTAPITDTLAEALAATPPPAPAPGDHEPVTLAVAINRALRGILAAYPQATLFGEDVARKGGVYGVTRGLPTYEW